MPFKNHISGLYTFYSQKNTETTHKNKLENTSGLAPSIRQSSSNDSLPVIQLCRTLHVCFVYRMFICKVKMGHTACK